MEERLRRVEDKVSNMESIAVEAIIETRHAVLAVQDLTKELKNLASHMAKSEERHTAQQDVNSRHGRILEQHSIDITEIKIATGRSEVKTSTMWSAWTKIAISGGAVFGVAAAIAKSLGVI